MTTSISREYHIRTLQAWMEDCAELRKKNIELRKKIKQLEAKIHIERMSRYGLLNYGRNIEAK